MGKWDVQSSNDDATVKVSDSYCRDGSVQTDLLVFDRSDTSGNHAHYSYDQYGNEVYGRNPYYDD